MGLMLPEELNDTTLYPSWHKTSNDIYVHNNIASTKIKRHQDFMCLPGILLK